MRHFYIFCLSLYLTICHAFWDLGNLQDFLNKYVKLSKHKIVEKRKVSSKELKEICDENQFLLQFARLYATSPERIILLLSTNSLSKTCQDIADVTRRINDTMSNCMPLQSDNLYMKLYNGLEYFNSYICLHNPNIRGNYLINYHTCLTELHEDLLDCEGPPDWFEKSNEAVVCQSYNDIINCNYIKTAMLCGLKPALLLRRFSDEVMKRIVKFKCKISRSLPHIDDPMLARACHWKCHKHSTLYTYCIAIVCAYINTFYLFMYVYF